MEEEKKVQVSPEKLKLLAEVNERMRELDELKEIEDMIQDNTIEWTEDGGKAYRVRKPGRRERLEIRTAKNKRYNELVKDPKNVTEDEMIKILLERETPVDIPKMRQNMIALQRKIENLGAQYTECQIKSDKAKIEDQVIDLQEQQNAILHRISELLSTCIEKQLKDFIQEYLIYVCFQKKTDNGWERYFTSYEEFLNSNDLEEDKLVYKATYYLAVLINQDG